MNQILTFKRAAETDFAELLNCDPFAQTAPLRQEWLKTALRARYVLIAEYAGAIVGFAVMKHRFFGHGFVSLITVKPVMRRRRYALALLAESERLCTTAKIFTSTNASNVAAQKLFLRAGFVRSGQIDNIDKDDTELIYFKAIDVK